MTESRLPPTFLPKVAESAHERARAWDAVADVLEVPDVALLTRLRSGDLAAIWRQSAAWLGDDTHMLTPELMSLDVYARSAPRRTLAQDLADFRAGYEEHVAPDVGFLLQIRRLADICRQESQAWSGGDIAQGRALRASQQEFIDAQLVPGLPELGRRLVDDAQVNVWRLLGRLILAILSVETGRDYQRAVLGEGLGRRRNPR